MALGQALREKEPLRMVAEVYREAPFWAHPLELAGFGRPG